MLKPKVHLPFIIFLEAIASLLKHIKKALIEGFKYINKKFLQKRHS